MRLICFTHIMAAFSFSALPTNAMVEATQSVFMMGLKEGGKERQRGKNVQAGRMSSGSSDSEKKEAVCSGSPVPSVGVGADGKRATPTPVLFYFSDSRVESCQKEGESVH